MAEKVVEFSSAVRGYHHYRKYWQPKLEEHLSCRHEENNPFVYFAISVCDKNTGAIVGHLPIETSRPTTFLLDRGAMIYDIDINELLCFAISARRVGNSLSR